MKNVTLAFDDDLLKAGREYARKHNTSLNDLLRGMLAERVQPESKDWLNEYFTLARQAKAKPAARRWKREDLYDV